MRTVTLDNIFLSTLASLDAKLKQNPPIWTPTCKFWNLMELTPDGLGEFGENFATTLLKELGKPYDIKCSTSTDVKEYDILITHQLSRMSMGVEVKTATLGNSAPSFQHENIEPRRRFDAILFMDFAPDELYATFLTKSEIPFDRCEPHNKLLPHPGPIHQRKERSGVYKWDFKIPGPRSKQNGVLMNRVSTIEDFLSKYRNMESRYLKLTEPKRDFGNIIS